MFLQKIANLFRSRKFWALILSFITITAALVMGEINFWQFTQGALVALAIFSTGIAIEDMALGWRTPGEQHMYDQIMFSIPEQLRMILTSRKFWVLLTALATSTAGLLTNEITVWQFAQAVIAALSVYSTTVAIDDSGRKENSLAFIQRQIEDRSIPF